MPRIKPLTHSQAPNKSRPMLERVQKALGMTPNLVATLAHSSAALQAYLGFGQAMGTGELGAALHEQIALGVAGENTCGYCASAHTAIGKQCGLSEVELARNLSGTSDDARTAAAIEFARTIVARRGRIGDSDLAAIRDAGFSESQIVEIVASVALNIFTNYFNHIAQTEIDFPRVMVAEPVAA